MRVRLIFYRWKPDKRENYKSPRDYVTEYQRNFDFMKLIKHTSTTTVCYNMSVTLHHSLSTQHSQLNRFGYEGMYYKAKL